MSLNINNTDALLKVETDFTKLQEVDLYYIPQSVDVCKSKKGWVTNHCP